MTTKWIKTKYPGVRYREHETRKCNNGIMKDRYFTIRYKLDGKGKEEALGWSTQGWTVEKAAARLAELKEAHRTGKGAVTLKEAREEASQKRRIKKEKQEREEKEKTTVKDFYEYHYKKHAQSSLKPHTFDSEDKLYKKWLESRIGNMAIKDVGIKELEDVKEKMFESGRSLRSIEYAMLIYRKIFQYAKMLNFVFFDCPTDKLPPIKYDNKRERFLTEAEAEQLLNTLKSKSVQLYQIAMLSLYCGLRAGEIFGLYWSDVDIPNELIYLHDTKNKRNRVAYMTNKIKEMFSSMPVGAKDDLVFKSRTGDKIKEVSNVFALTVDELGFNHNIQDPRQKVVFHTLRHTFASWLVKSGVSLYDVQKLMGHSNISMTERYAHLAPEKLKESVKTLEAERR